MPVPRGCLLGGASAALPSGGRGFFHRRSLFRHGCFFRHRLFFHYRRLLFARCLRTDILGQAREIASGGHPVLVNALLDRSDFREGSISI